MSEQVLNVSDSAWIIPGYSEDALIAIKCEILSIDNGEVTLNEPLGHTVSIEDLFRTKSEAKRELFNRWNSLRKESRDTANLSVNTTIRNFREYYLGHLASAAGQDIEAYRSEHWDKDENGESKLKYKRRRKEWFNVRDVKLERKSKGIMPNFQFKKLSKLIAYLLRHKPEAGNLELDSMGACKIDDLLKAVNAQLPFKVTRKNIERLARPSTNPEEKQRYIIEGEYIRAGHGHSIEIAGYEEITPTGDLYHGTPSYIVEKIAQDCLSRMTRDKVHLSYDEPLTLEAARRRSRKVTLLRVKTQEAMEAGIKFYKAADDRVVLSDDIPPQFLEQQINEEWVPLVSE